MIFTDLNSAWIHEQSKKEDAMSTKTWANAALAHKNIEINELMHVSENHEYCMPIK